MSLMSCCGQTPGRCWDRVFPPDPRWHLNTRCKTGSEKRQVGCTHRMRETKRRKKRGPKKNNDLKETDGDRERQITKHLLRVKILKCPNCLKWCRVSKAVEQSAADKTELSKSSMDDSWLFSFPCVCVWRSIVPLLCLSLCVCERRAQRLIICISARSWIIFSRRLERYSQNSTIQLN